MRSAPQAAQRANVEPFGRSLCKAAQRGDLKGAAAGPPLTLGEKSSGGASAIARQMTLELPTEQDMVRLPDMTDWERMVADYGLLGLSPSYHPMALLRPDVPQQVLNAEQVRGTRDGARIKTAGLVVCRQRPGTAKGFVFLLLEDETGVVNVVIRPDLYEAKRSTIRGEPYLCIEGSVQLQSGTLNIIAHKVTPLSEHTSASEALPRAPERNAIPGALFDKREQAGRELTMAAPASRNFH